MGILGGAFQELGYSEGSLGGVWVFWLGFRWGSGGVWVVFGWRCAVVRGVI